MLGAAVAPKAVLAAAEALAVPAAIPVATYYGRGLYDQLREGNRYTYTHLTYKKLEEAMQQLQFSERPTQIWMNEAAHKEFNRQLKKQAAL